MRTVEPAEDWRDFAVSEIDYSERGPRQLLGLHPYDCRAYMIRSRYWKFILHERFEPQLFDIANDVHEYRYLGTDPAFESVRNNMRELCIYVASTTSRAH